MEAGAGTGKTTMLVDRVVNLVTSGERARMDQIAAITFTEAAAAELRDRLSQAFERRASAEPDGPAAAAAAGLDASAVTTLHGFARKLLSEHPFAVGLPRFSKWPMPVRAGSPLTSAGNVWSIDLLRSPSHDELVTRALSCGMTWERLRLAALACDENWDRLTEVNAVTVPPPIDGTQLAALMAQAVTLGAALQRPR